MKKEDGMMIALNSELASYFKQHPDQLPAAVDVNSLEIKCMPYLIEHIEEYAHRPFTDKFLWNITFPGSRLPGFQYKYFITYQARYMGECGVVAVDMVSGELADPGPWYLHN
ncbi:MAG TPA: hypothetical protein VFE54_13580 [Mucilaginibacter sp.]|jgi:hypothetical protein|nr:hypothetical protein [Mucilaginibacter sp.]